jgi:hypothetical protein
VRTVLGARCAAIGFLTLLVPSAVAQAGASFSVSGENEVAVGHDTNLLLTATPGAAGSTRVGGWYASISPALIVGASEGGYRLEASYTGDLRFAETVGHLYYQGIALGGSLRAFESLRVDLGALAGRFDTGQFPDEQFRFWGGQLGLRLALSDSVRTLASYRINARTPNAVAGDQELLHLGDLRLSYRPTSRFEVAPGASLLRIQPSGPAAQPFDRLRGGLDVGAVRGWLTAIGGVWGGRMAGPLGTEFELGGRLEARAQLRPDLDASLTVEGAFPLGQGAVGAYARRYVALGLIAHATTRATPAAPSPRADLKPTVAGGRVRLRIRVERAATTVSVIGSWDDWKVPGERLRPTAERDVWEATIALPAGSHRYRFLVDGEAQRPPEASRYAPDGFGGEDGVIEVEGPGTPP